MSCNTPCNAETRRRLCNLMFTFCDLLGGSLENIFEEYRKAGRSFTERELVHILLQVALGLQYIHSERLAHLDIKPANILIHREPVLLSVLSEHDEILDELEYFETDASTSTSCRILYKIGT